MLKKLSHGHVIWVYQFLIRFTNYIPHFSGKNHPDCSGNLFKFRYRNITKGIYFKALLYFLVDELAYVFVLVFGNPKKLTNSVQYSYSIIAMLFACHLFYIVLGSEWVKTNLKRGDYHSMFYR